MLAARAECRKARKRLAHGVLAMKWDELPSLFSDRRSRKEKEGEELLSELYRQIGQLKVELEWLKKKSQMLQWKKREN